MIHIPHPIPHTRRYRCSIGSTMRLKLSWLRYQLLLSAIATILLFTPRALAAEQVVLKYKIFRASLSVRELTIFTETGELSSSLEAYLDMGKQNPTNVRRTLISPVNVDLIFLDRLLNSSVGNILLDRVSLAVHTPSNRANRQALRAALVLSASDDGQLTLMEIIQKYPTREVHVEGDRLLKAYNTLQRLAGHWRNISDIINFF